MPQHLDSKQAKQELQQLSEALSSGAFVQVRRLLNHSLPPAEVAHLLESSPPKVRHILWSLVDKDHDSDVLHYLSDDVVTDILSRMDTQELLDATEGLGADDTADILQHLPDQVTQEVLRLMDSHNRERIETVLSFPEDTAGGMMDVDTITIRPDISLDVVLRYLRRHPKIPEMTDNLFVVNRKDRLIGTLPTLKILVSDPSASVREIMDTDLISINVDMPEKEVALLFEKHDLVTAPVIDADRKVLGRITIDDVVDVIRDEGEHSFMGMAGLDEDEDTFTPTKKALKRRTIWLFINLLTAILAASVIDQFKDTIDQVVALAVLMPIVASMGGIAGSQTLTLMIRGIALGHVEGDGARWLLRREAIIGVVNGVIWALVVALLAAWWFQEMTIGIIIALAMVINLIAAAVSGAVLPLILRSLKIDPAVSASVILTTVTDVVGFFAFLGLATAFYT